MSIGDEGRIPHQAWLSNRTQYGGDHARLSHSTADNGQMGWRVMSFNDEIIPREKEGAPPRL